MSKKVFLGGTCNDSRWREGFVIPNLKIDYFNPVVENWTEDCKLEEIRQRETCDFCLYVITPNMTGVYSIAEVTDDSNKRPEKTVFCICESDIDKYGNKIEFTKSQMTSLIQVGLLVKNNGGKFLSSLQETVDYLNSFGE